MALYPAEHVWVMTEPAEGAREESPFLRDLDGYLYIRHHRGSYVIGAFEPNGKPMAPDLVPTTGFVELGPDWDHFAPVLANARQRLPELETIGFSHYLRAPESFTPDAAFQLGEFPEVPGLWVAAGLNSQGIIYGPGVGMALSEWIVEGHPTYDLTDVDVARMGRWSNARSWLRERTVESLGGLYEMHWPGKQPVTARGIRRIPLWDRMRAAGASFGQAAGWERANWFEPGTVDPEVTYDFVEPSWLPSVREEVRATREAVALYDLSTYSKFMVEGPSALADLQRLCTANIDVAIGRVVYTMICNERGGIEMDPTVTRMAEDRFLVLAPTLAQRRTEMLLRNGAGARDGGHRRHERVGHPASGRAPVAGAVGASHRRGPLERGVPVPVGTGDRGGLDAGVGVPRLVHRRVGLGAVGADGVRERPVRPDRGGRRRSRSAARRRLRLRCRPAGAGLPLVGP